jgi:hypothetical protein
MERTYSLGNFAPVWRTKAGDIGASRAERCRFYLHLGGTVAWLFGQFMTIEPVTLITIGPIEPELHTLEQPTKVCGFIDAC